MSDAGAPENPAPEETSTPPDARPEDAQSSPAGTRGDDIPDAAPASSPAGAPADEATPAPAGAGAETQATPHEPSDAPAGAPAEAPADADAPADAAAGEAPEPTPEPTPEPEPDPLRDPVAAQLREALGDAVLEVVVARSDLTVRVANADWRRTVQWCKDHGFTYFCFLSGIDWLPDPDAASRYENTFGGASEESAVAAEIQTGVAGGDTRFQVFCRLYDTERKLGLTLKADLDDADPTVESITGVYRGAEWHEREAWEMFGFDFAGHPGLRHLYLPTEFEGFPLRKDFPLLARVVKPWPGLVDKEPIPGEGDEEEAEAPA